MPNLGSFIVFAPTGGADVAPTNLVTVPGNAEDYIERAEGTGLVLTMVDENTLSIVLPDSEDPEAVLELATALQYVFTAPVSPDIGWFAVTAAGILGMADSSDADLAPDYVPVVGSVTFIPSFNRPIKIVSSNRFFAVTPTVAEFDSDGELSYQGGKQVRLISPVWDDLSSNDWSWTAQVRPGPGQSWEGFDVTAMRPAPGTTVDLVDFL